MSPAQFPQFLPGTSPAEARLSPKEAEWVELWGSKTSLDSRTERPTCRLAWPPTLSLSDKSYRVAVWARCPWRGKHFIKLKCFYNGGTETSAQCGIHGHHARFPLPDCPTPQSCKPRGLSQRTSGAARRDSLPPKSSPQFYTHYSPECLLLALTPPVWGP